jgi:Flp pilus assembly protein TadD
VTDAAPRNTADEQAPLIPPDVERARRQVEGLLAQNRIEDAIACYRALLARHPKLSALHAAIGALLRRRGRHEEALLALEQAHSLLPNEPSLCTCLAVVLQEMGRIDEAAAQFRHAIAMAPDEPAHYLGLVRLQALAADDPALTALRQLARQESRFNTSRRASLHFALGKALTDAGEPQEGFSHFLRANALRRADLSYDEAAVLGAMRQISQHFTADAMAALTHAGHPSTQPVFIVGMPRSGSTLVEQILASHPDAYGAGEASTLADTLKDAAKRCPAWKSPMPFPALSEAECLATAEDYLGRINSLAVDWPHPEPPRLIVNKMLDNFAHIGLIRRLWPKARIIHTVRDPIDTCLSCFSIPFDHLEFTFDLGELGRYYRQYRALMAHWEQVLPPEAILTVRYEDLVQNLPHHAQRIIAYCGLPWNPDCLKFHENRRIVRTSSLAQVRTPLYRSALHRWRPDNESLRPLLEGLGSAG